ncbi:hypothetical protein EAO69_30180, partial [Streptomyces sp. me109]
MDGACGSRLRMCAVCRRGSKICHPADAFHAGEHLALQAGAGTGKTTTLAELARATRRRGRYLAYNR